MKDFAKQTKRWYELKVDEERKRNKRRAKMALTQKDMVDAYETLSKEEVIQWDPAGVLVPPSLAKTAQQVMNSAVKQRPGTSFVTNSINKWVYGSVSTSYDEQPEPVDTRSPAERVVGDVIAKLKRGEY